MFSQEERLKYFFMIQSLAILFCLYIGTFATVVSAQTSVIDSPVIDESADRLEVLQTLIDANLVARVELREAIKNADPVELSELQLSLELLTTDVNKLRDSFEQTAIGAVDVAVLGDADTAFDWREEVTEILQPIVENLKALTDKPRKIGKLQAAIEQNEIQRMAIDSALNSIGSKLRKTENTTVLSSLTDLMKDWERRRVDNVQSLSLAQLQLANLQRSDESWWDTFRRALAEFFTGRGLTLALAAVMAALVWFLMLGVLKLVQLRVKNEAQEDFKTRKKLAQYAYHTLTLLLILIAIISVFYIRGDMLLMGLSILAAAAIAVGLRQAIPRFINEAKILLDLGSVRENERVFHNGLPWQVVSLNMHSVLRNPELKGTLRIPLSEISQMISRPAGTEPWYPAGRGDFIVLDDSRLMQVVRLTPETVELKDRGGSITAVPANEFYQWTFRNLCRGESFGISAIFGVDYRHQSISLSDVPARFRIAIQQALQNTEYAEAVRDVKVELKTAGSSSLDYWIYVTMDRSAAKGYSTLDRLIQQTCVHECTVQNWGIPFPHLTVQQLDTPPS